MIRKNAIFLLLAGCLFLSCCGQKGATKSSEADVSTARMKGADVSSRSVTAGTDKTSTNAPAFDADSACAYVERQVAFGPRVPNSEAHKKCAAYLAAELERHGATLYLQDAIVTAYNGDKLEAVNIIGAFHPDQTRRVLLFAHWDSRPYADQDEDKANHYTPIDGADDGGSGVGVLLEIARQIGKQAPAIGVDIIFFDAEDYGPPTFLNDHTPNPWCLGSQFWAKNPHVPDYKAEYGILLDMVGSKGATFYKELTSVKYAAQYVEKIWSTARNLGYGKYFINAKDAAIIDDHQYVIEGRRIPCLDVINLNPGNNKHGFGLHWHTVNDKMAVIDKNTLKAVGHTILEVIYSE
jgi:hypothetical protein